jgi:hypothetical protein
MIKITKQELIDKINDIKGNTFVSIDIKSELRMRKTDNPYLGAEKIVRLSGAINFDYTNSVNSQLTREGKEATFEAKPRKWGTRVGNWITHNNNHYLNVKVQDSSEPIYLFNEAVIAKKKLEQWLQVSSKPKTQETLETEVVVRDIKIDNIKIIRMMGEEYVVV